MVEGERVKYFVGTFADVAKQIDIATLQPAAIVNIDSDLYVSAKDALNLVSPKLQQGSVLLMDDWNCFNASPEKGERKALREFLDGCPEIQAEPWFAYHYTGQAFIIHRKGNLE